MAEESTAREAAEPEESGPPADLALLVAALGGGPGDAASGAFATERLEDRRRQDLPTGPWAEAA